MINKARRENGVNIGDVDGGIQTSNIAGRDVIQIGSIKIPRYIFFAVSLGLAIMTIAAIIMSSSLFEIREASVASRTAVELDARYYERQGTSLFNANQYRSAIDDYTKAIGLDTSNAELYVNRGRCYQALEEYDLAASDFTRAIALRGGPIETAYLSRGNAYLGMEEYEKAIADYEKAITFGYERQWLPHRSIGFAHLYLGEYDQAVDDFTTAGRLTTKDPDMADMYTYRGIAYYLLDDYESAIQDFNKSLELEPDPTHHDVYFYLGLAYWFGRRDPVRAVAEFEKYDVEKLSRLAGLPEKSVEQLKAEIERVSEYLNSQRASEGSP